jgi:hypothetical protein
MAYLQRPTTLETCNLTVPVLPAVLQQGQFLLPWQE